MLSTAALAQNSEPAPLSDQPAEAATAEPAQPAAPSEIILPALSPVNLVVVDEISSKTAVTGAPVQLKLASPIYVTSDLGVPAGTKVEGMVIHAAKGGMGGKSGELLIGAKRIIVSDTVSIPLRSFKLGPAEGKDNEALAMGMAIAGGAIGGVASMFITGGSAKVPAGSAANAKTKADTAIPVTLLSKLPSIQPATVSPPAVQASISQATPTQGDTK